MQGPCQMKTPLITHKNRRKLRRNCSLRRVTPRSFCAAAKSDRKSTRLNSSHGYISYAVFCLKKKNESNFATANDLCPDSRESELGLKHGQGGISRWVLWILAWRDRCFPDIMRKTYVDSLSAC